MKNVINKIVQLVIKKTPQVPPQTTTSTSTSNKNNDNVEYLDPGVAFFMNFGKEHGFNFSVDQVETHKVEDLADMPFEKDNPFLNRRIIYYKNKRKTIK